MFEATFKLSRLSLRLRELHFDVFQRSVVKHHVEDSLSLLGTCGED